MKFDRLHFYAILSSVIAAACFALMIASVQAAEQEFNEEQTAYNEAIRIVIERGCVPKFARSKPYTVISDDEKITIRAKEVTQNCKAKAISTITWKAPDSDINGKKLAPGFITGYRITLNGELLAVTSSTEYRTDRLSLGDSVGLQTLGKNGINSEIVTALVK